MEKLHKKALHLNQKIINRSLFKVVILFLLEEKNYFIDAGTLLVNLVIKKGDLVFDGRVI